MDRMREEIAEILPKSQHKKIDDIIALIEERLTVFAVTANCTRVPVETVEAYGLILGVDANGDATTVEFPYGAEIDE